MKTVYWVALVLFLSLSGWGVAIWFWSNKKAQAEKYQKEINELVNTRVNEIVFKKDSLALHKKITLKELERNQEVLDSLINVIKKNPSKEITVGDAKKNLLNL